MTPTILIVNAGADTGGQSIRIARAFARCAPDWTVRAITSGRNYIEFPTDVPWSRAAVEKLWRKADVVHVASPRTLKLFRRMGARPSVMHYHGTAYRRDPGPFLAEQARHRAVGLVSTLDLLAIAPDRTAWLPAPYDLDELAAMRRRRRGGPIRIAHAPTERQIKSTPAFLAAVEQLRGEGHRFDVDLIEGVTWAECLERKAQADIYFDQVILGYGNNSIEAWGMGIPVIAGGGPDTLALMRERFGGTLPFYTATEETIVDALRAMLLSEELRAEYAERGADHARTFHADAVIVDQLKGVYAQAWQQFHGRASGWAA